MDSEHLLDITRRTRHILDAQYEKYDLHKVASNKKHLTDDDRNALQNLQTKYEFLFD